MLRSYERMANVDYGEDSPEKNRIILSMGTQLARNIDDLEKVMYKDPLRMIMAQSINKTNKE